MSKEDIINYVMTTPGNPNRAVLEGMLDSVAEAGGGRLRVNIASSDQTEGTITYDKTWQEVHDALESGMDVTYTNPTVKMQFRILQARSTFDGSRYIVVAEGASGASGTPGSTATLVLDPTIFSTLSSPDEYLIAQSGSSGGSGTTPPIGTMN